MSRDFQMLKRTKNVADFYTEETVSQTAIARASDAFTYHYGKRPDILAMHYSTARDLYERLDKRTYIDLKTFMGLEIYLDPELKDGEWCVRKQEERVDAVYYK